MGREIEVEIFDRDVLVHRTACTLRELPDGTREVLWRGVPYPLLDGNRIDVSDPLEATPTTGSALTPPLCGSRRRWRELGPGPWATGCCRRPEGKA